MVFRVERRRDGLCPRCGEHPKGVSGYCLACHAEYMREWRSAHPLTDEQRKKDNARSYASVYLRRGKLTREPCERCGSDDAQMHHEDYYQPLKVRWLCRWCRRKLHRATPRPAGA